MIRMPWSRFTGSLMVLGVLMSVTVVFDLQYRGFHRHPVHPEWPLGDGDPARGRTLIEEYGCGACHTIPGVRQASGRVGPKLEDFVHQMYIAGVLTNTPENLAAWLQRPRQINPLTAMPDLQVSETEALDMVAYLYSMR